jgi:putative transposase
MGWRRRTVLDRALRVLVTCRRLAAGRKRRPTAAIVDTQSVKTGPPRGPRGYDAHKKVKGREDYKRVATISANGETVIGEILADLTQSGETRHDIDLLRLRRFAAQSVGAS